MIIELSQSNRVVCARPTLTYYSAAFLRSRAIAKIAQPTTIRTESWNNFPFQFVGRAAQPLRDLYVHLDGLYVLLRWSWCIIMYQYVYTHLNMYIYIYIYVCMFCLCLCATDNANQVSPGPGLESLLMLLVGRAVCVCVWLLGLSSIRNTAYTVYGFFCMYHIGFCFVIVGLMIKRDFITVTLPIITYACGCG